MRGWEAGTNSIHGDSMPLPLQQDFAPFHVLVADGDPSIRHACCAIAAGEGMVPHEAEITDAARGWLLSGGTDIVWWTKALPRVTDSRCWRNCGNCGRMSRWYG